MKIKLDKACKGVPGRLFLIYRDIQFSLLYKATRRYHKNKGVPSLEWPIFHEVKKEVSGEEAA